MIRLYRMKLILSTALVLSSCAKSGGPVEVFPAKYIYSVRAFKNKCSKHKIINFDPVTVDKGEMVDMRECESVFGFSVADAGPVFNWIRNTQEVAKKRCK